MFKYLFACMAILTGCTSIEQKALESPAYKASFRIFAQDQICWQGIISKLIESETSETIQGCGSKSFTWDDGDVANMNFFNVLVSAEIEQETCDTTASKVFELQLFINDVLAVEDSEDLCIGYAVLEATYRNP
jgi:hypothetical protein